MIASDIIRAAPTRPARPWPRHALTPTTWRDMARALPRQPELRFEALWADVEQVYALFTRPDPLLLSAPIEAGLYAALSPVRPAAAPFERAVSDLWGHVAADALDARPLLDHGLWPVLQPFLPHPVPNTSAPEPIELHAVPEGSALCRSGPIGPGGPVLLATESRGERITQIDPVLGFAHRGVLRLLRGRPPAEAAPLAARLSGAGTVANSLAFARAVEAACGIEPPPRAIAIRLVLLDLERVAIGLHDIAATLEAAGHDPAPTRLVREDLLRACQATFGHRLLMDMVIPGGIARDMSPENAAAVAAPLQSLHLPALPPRLSPLRGRIEAVRAALHTLLTRPRTLPEGALLTTVPITVGEGLGQADGPRGVHFWWVQMRDGRVLQAFARDPAAMLWTELATAASGQMLADLPVWRAALAPSAAGADG